MLRFFSLHIAFYIGVGLSIVLYLRKAASPEVVEYSYDEEAEELRPMLPSEKPLKKKIRIINIEGELFFGAVDIFQSALKAIAEDDEATRVLSYAKACARYGCNSSNSTQTAV